jgi:RimJ/RimL family protein N-acetyltransferase
MKYLEARFTRAMTSDHLVEYVRSMLASSDSFLLAVLTNESHEHIGNIKLGPINRNHETASIGLFIGEKTWWGKGVATETIAAVSDWAFNSVNLSKLSAGAYATNIASIRAFERCGFSREGLLRSQVQLDSGTRDDVVLLGKVRPQ